MKSNFARRISILLVLAMVLAMLPVAAFAADSTKLYLQPNENWLKDGARFAAYFFGNGETWVSMTDADADGVYEVEAPAGYPNVIFCRMSGTATANNWNNKWNQTSDLVVPTDGTNLYVVAPGTWDKGNGSWSTFTPGDEVTEATTLPKAYSYYAAGDFNTWNECNDDYGLTLVDGVYTLTLELAAGTYNFKITDGTWTNSWGLNGGASNYEFVLDADATVVITFDDTTKVPAVTSNAMGEVTIYDYYLAGEMNGWTVNSSSMGLTANGDGTYSITIDMVAGTYAYKFTNGTWDVCFPAGMDNASITVAEDCAVTFTLNPADGTFTATGDGIGEPETPVEPPVDVEINAVNVKGTIPGIDWDADSVTGAMELVDGIYTITFPAVPASEVGAAAYAFKVMVNNSWDTAYPEADWTFYLNAECDVTITFNPADNTCAIYADGLTYDAPVDPEGGEDPETPVEPPVSEGAYYVAGSMNGWDAAAEGYAMIANGDGTYSLVLNLTVGNYQVKVTDGTWTNSWTAAEGEYLGNDGNLNFYVSADSEVIITFNGTNVSVSGANVSAKVPEALVIDKVVIAGGAAEGSTLGNFLYGQAWTENSSVNVMYAAEGTAIYSVTYYGVEAGTYEFKFVLNDGWAINFASGVEIESGVEATAWFNAMGNSTFTVTEDGSNVTFVLDLTNTINVGDNALMTVTIEAPASVSESKAPDYIQIGENKFVIATGDTNIVAAPYVATYTGILYVTPTAMSAVNWMGEMEEIPAQYISMQFMRAYGLTVNGETLWGNEIEVVEGETYMIGVVDYMGAGAEITLTVCDGHEFVEGACSKCGYVCEYHNWDNGTCLNCGAVCNHENWDGGWCTGCWMQCEHEWTYTYTKGVSHSFTCSGVCGASVSVDDTTGKQFKFNTAAPVLSVDIAMNIGATVPAGFEFSYITVEFNGEMGYYDATYNESNGRYEFTFSGINPQTMGDTFYATIYAYVDGYEVSATLEYSMVKYINSQLKKTTTTAELRTALSDLVVYGEANQVYENYKTDAKLSTLLESTDYLTPSTFAELDDSYNQQVTSGTKDANIDLKGITMALGAKVVVRLTIYCADPSAYSVKVNLNGEDFIYPVSELALADGYTDRYVVAFDQIRSTQFGETITFSFLDAEGNQVGRSMTYSVYTYVYKNQTAEGALGDLLKALYNYGEAVKKA